MKNFLCLLAVIWLSLSSAGYAGEPNLIAQMYVSSPANFTSRGFPEFETGVLLAVTNLGADMTVVKNTLSSQGCTLIDSRDLSFIKLLKIGVGGNTLATAAQKLTNKGLIGVQPNWLDDWQQMIPSGMPVVNDQYFPLQAYLMAVNVPDAWQTMKSLNRISPVRIAVLDSGFSTSSYNVPTDLAGKISGGNYTNGVSYLVDDVNPKGHGSMLASIVAANTDNRTGIAGVNRYAPADGVYGINISRGAGLGTDDWNILQGLDKMIKDAPDCKIALIGAAPSSKGWTLLNHPLVHAMLSTYYCRNGLVFAPAGNDYKNLDAAAVKDNTLVLVGSCMNDAKGHLGFTNGGSAIWFFEPGMQIYSMDRYGGLFYLTGTSGSAAIGAGIACLAQSFRGGNAFINGAMLNAIANSANNQYRVVNAKQLIESLR